MIGTVFAIVCLFVRMEEYQICFRDLMLYLGIGIIGLLLIARLVFAIAMIPSMDNVSLQNFCHYLFYGGIVFYGGLLGLLGFVAIVAKIKNDDLNHIYNYMAPAIPLFHAWARIGCLFAGCCYGKEWNGPEPHKLQHGFRPAEPHRLPHRTTGTNQTDEQTGSTLLRPARHQGEQPPSRILPLCTVPPHLDSVAPALRTGLACLPADALHRGRQTHTLTHTQNSASRCAQNLRTV